MTDSENITITVTEEDEALIAHWAMDDDATDTTVADSHGSNTGYSVRHTEYLSTTGVIDDALSFNGISDRVVVPDSGSLDFGTGDFSISLWARTDGYVSKGSRWNCLVSKGLITKGTNPFYGMYIEEDSNKVYFAVGNDGYYGRSNLALNDGSFHHIVGLRDSGVVYLYVDGVLQSTSNGSAVNITNGVDFIIGADTLGSQRYFGGVIDQVKVFNKALSASEVRYLYNE